MVVVNDKSKYGIIFSIIMWFKLKIGISWILLSLTLMRMEDESLFWVYFNNLVLFVFVDTIYRYLYDRINLSIFYQITYLILSVLWLVIAE